MNIRAKKQLTLIIVVAVLLILSIVAAIILMPSGTKRVVKKNPVNNVVSTDDSKVVETFDITGRIFDADGYPMANCEFMISVGSTLFITDENGFFKLNGLPVGIHSIYAVDKDGNKTGETVFQLSNDGSCAVDYFLFEPGETVNMMFDGAKFIGFRPKNQSVNADSSKNEEVLPVVPEEEDETYTNLSWMKDLPKEFGAYGINTQSEDLFYDIVPNKDYDYVNTFLVGGAGWNLDRTKFEAEYLAKNNKNFFLNVERVISAGTDNVNANLNGSWRQNLEQWASELKAVGGDHFQGFYFDEVDLYINSRDFTRVTKYMREHFKLRTFAVHRLSVFTIPSGKNMSIINYHPAKDEFVITPENHKYVTDVGYWWYGGYRHFGYNAERISKIWSDAMSMLDPNTRKWVVPPIGTYDYRHSEEDMMEVAYAMYRDSSALEGFGGLLFYTMGGGSLWGQEYSEVTPDDKRLTDDDFLKDEDGNYVLDPDGNKIVSIKNNYCYPAVMEGKQNYSGEGNGQLYIYWKLDNGDYLWSRAHKYFEIIGRGITGNTSRDTVLNELNAVFTPDYSKYKK